ncbi:hypothetical protein HS125_17940 [bacterium]|nr:hypothetical protein [bacterium]
MKNPGRLIMAVIVVLLAAYTYYFYKGPKNTGNVGPTAAGQAEQAARLAAGGDVEAFFPKDTFLALKLDVAEMEKVGADSGWKEAFTTPDLSGYVRRVVGTLDPEIQTLARVLGGYIEGEVMLGVMPPTRLDVETTLAVPAVLVGRLDKTRPVGFLAALRNAYRQDFPQRSEVLVTEAGDVWSIATRKSKLYCSWQEEPGLFFASMDADLLKRTLARPAAAADSLAQNPQYAQIKKKFARPDSGRALLLAFCDVKTTVNNLYAYMEQQGRVDSLREKQYYDLRRLVDGLGATHVRSLAFLVESASDGVRSTRYVDLGGKYEGLLHLFSTRGSEELQSPALVPADLAAFSAAVLQLGPTWDAVKKAMDKIGGSPAAAFAQLSGAFASTTGVSLDDLFNEMGDELAVGYSTSRPEPVLILARTKSDRGARLLKEMAERMGLSVQRGSLPHGPSYSVGRGAAFPFSHWSAFTYKEPFTYWADSPETLVAVFEAQAAGRVMAERPDLRALASQMPGDRHVMQFVSPDYLAARASERPDGLFSLGLVRRLPVDLSAQRSLLEPRLSLGQYAGDGIVLRGLSRKGGDLGQEAVLLLGAVPDLLRLRDRYQVMLLRERLTMVDEAKKRLAQMYGLSQGTPITADGEGKNTYDLLTAGLLSEQPVCPITRQPLIVNPIGVAPTSPLFEEEGQAGLEAMLRESLRPAAPPSSAANWSSASRCS